MIKRNMTSAFFQQEQSETAKTTAHNYTLTSQITGMDFCFVNRTLSCLQILYQLQENLIERLFKIAVTAQKLDASVVNIDDVKSCLYQKTTTFVEANIQDIFFNNASQACFYIPDFINGLRVITKTTPIPNNVCIKIGAQMQREITAVCKKSASLLASTSHSPSRSQSFDATQFKSKSQNNTSTKEFRSSVSQSDGSSTSISKTPSLSTPSIPQSKNVSTLSSDTYDATAITASVASILVLVAVLAVIVFKKYHKTRQRADNYIELTYNTPVP